MERAAEEEIGNAQAEAPDEEVERAAEERSARARRALDRVARERLARAEVRLAPLGDAEEHARDDARLHDERVLGRVVERPEEGHEFLALLRSEGWRRGTSRREDTV